MTSNDDGFSWITLEAELIPPELDNILSWKHSYVYGFDTVPGNFSFYCETSKCFSRTKSNAFYTAFFVDLKYLFTFLL